MPEHLKALIFICTAAFFMFHLSKKHIDILSSEKNYELRKNVWFVLTCGLFIVGNFFVYCLILVIACSYLRNRVSNQLVIYYSILFVAPPLEKVISGGGIINQLFAVNHPRILSLFILLPIAYKSGSLFKIKSPIDLFVTAYFILLCLLNFRGTTFTDGIRYGLYDFLDVYLPYIVFSHYATSRKQMYDILLAFVTSCVILAAVASIEFFRNWLLYSSVVTALGLDWGINSYIARAGHLRAMASVAQPIALGYVLTVALGFWMIFKNYKVVDSQGNYRGFISKNSWPIITAILTAGLIASLSRGPWIAMGFLVMVFIFSGPKALFAFFKFLFFSAIGFGLAMLTQSGRNIIDTLPFIGTAEQNNVEYRQILLEATNSVISRNLLLGSTDYTQSPEFLSISSGQVDIVNTYVLIALDSGIIGVFLFVMPFIIAILSIFNCLRRLSFDLKQHAVLGRGLLAVLLSTLLTLATVSPISYIPIVYWSVLGLSVAYIRLMTSHSVKD